MRRGVGRRLATISAWAVVPWSGFVGAFLYYVLLTAIILGGYAPPVAVVGLAYAMPLLAYGTAVAAHIAAAAVRAVRLARPPTLAAQAPYAPWAWQ